MFLSIFFLSAPWLLFFWQLLDEFSLNPNYQFGLFVPLLMAYAVYLRLENRPLAAVPARLWILDGVLLLGFLCFWPLRLLFEANADWRFIQWLQGLLAAALTVLGCYRLGGKPYARHFLFVALMPLLSIPWPTGIEKSIGIQLMEGISAASVEVVHLLGYPAERLGNLIYLENGTTVGVEEACSGLRSLQGNILAGAFIGELLRLTIFSRGVLLALGVVTALFFNFVRSMLLVVTAATSGSELTLLLHDSAGWSILVVSFFTLYGLAKLFPQRPVAIAIHHPKIAPLPLPLALCGVALLSFTEPLVSLYYPSAPLNTKISDLHLRAPSDLGLPEDVATAEAARFRSLLFYDEGTSWNFNTDEGEWVLFYFKWDSPRLSRLGGAYHSPERCLPNTGWRLLGEPKEVMLTLSASLQIPASITQFTDGKRYAMLLFSHWGLSGETIGADTRLDPAGRWDDFRNRRRLSSRRALQVALINTTGDEQTEKALIQFTQSALVEGR